MPLPSPPIAPIGKTTELPSNLNSLDLKLGNLYGKTLAMSNESMTAWMCPRVIPLMPNGKKPSVDLGVECSLISHSKNGNYLELILDGKCGTRGTLRLTFPQQGWKLHLVEPVATSAIPTQVANTIGPTESEQGKPTENKQPTESPKPTNDTTEDSTKKKRDDLLRSIFS